MEPAVGGRDHHHGPDVRAGALDPALLRARHDDGSGALMKKEEDQYIPSYADTRVKAKIYQAIVEVIRKHGRSNKISIRDAIPLVVEHVGENVDKKEVYPIMLRASNDESSPIQSTVGRGGGYYFQELEFPLGQLLPETKTKKGGPAGERPLAAGLLLAQNCQRCGELLPRYCERQEKRSVGEPRRCWVRYHR